MRPTTLFRFLQGVLLVLFTWGVASCAKLDAWKGQAGYNHKTGQIDTKLKGAGPGGEFNENTGLNISAGDNTFAALAIAAGVGILIFSAYPIQRSLRKWREERVLRDYRSRNQEE
jgi:hypothetical protein